jgi:hypothetical protein
LGSKYKYKYMNTIVVGNYDANISPD